MAIFCSLIGKFRYMLRFELSIDIAAELRMFEDIIIRALLADNMPPAETLDKHE